MRLVAMECCSRSHHQLLGSFPFIQWGGKSKAFWGGHTCLCAEAARGGLRGFSDISYGHVP